MGEQASRRYFTTAERFSAAQAQAMGFVHELCAPEELDARVAAIVVDPGGQRPRRGARLQAPGARRGRPTRSMAALRAETARRIADIRASDEGREGVQSFLNKRKPNWLGA